MKVGLRKDEMYPVYWIDIAHDLEYDIPQDLHDRWECVMTEFRLVQDKLSEIYAA
jgi:hypothetical protein